MAIQNNRDALQSEWLRLDGHKCIALGLSLTIRWRLKLMSNISIATTRRLSIILVLLDKYSFIIKLTFLVVCNCDWN